MRVGGGGEYVRWVGGVCEVGGWGGVCEVGGGGM